MDPPSATSAAPNMILEFFPIVTSPQTTAFGAIYALSWMLGVLSEMLQLHKTISILDLYISMKQRDNPGDQRRDDDGRQIVCDLELRHADDVEAQRDDDQ